MGKSTASDFYKLEEGVIRFYERNTGLDWMEAIVTPMATMISHANGSATNEVAENVTYHFDAQNYLFQMLLITSMEESKEAIGDIYLREKAWRHKGKARLKLKALLETPSALWEIINFKNEDQAYLKRVGFNMPPLLVTIPFGIHLNVEETQYFIGKVITPITKGQSIHILCSGGLPLTPSMVETIERQTKEGGGGLSERDRQLYLLKMAFIQWGIAHCLFVDEMERQYESNLRTAV